MTKNFFSKSKIQPKNAKIALIIINLGTIEKLDAKHIRQYYKRFLVDERVIDLNKLFWLPILYLFIIPFRPKKTLKLYQEIWDFKENSSPLSVFTKKIVEKLRKKYNKNEVIVDHAMRYGTKDIEYIIKYYTDQKIRKFVFAPLYPQYSSATTASVHDEITKNIQKLMWQPQYHITAPYYDNEKYIESIKQTITEFLSKKLETTAKPENTLIKKAAMDYSILVAFHGIPKSQFERGDPYYCFCQKTGRLIKEKLNWPEEKFFVCFQSRFGPKEWLKPYLSELISTLPQKNHKKLLVISPGFSVDCLETLHELAIETKDDFIKAGGEEFCYIPCLNDSDLQIELIDNIANPLIETLDKSDV